MSEIIEFNTDEEFLKRLAMILDNERFYYISAWEDDDRFDVKYLGDSMRATGGYFLRLTLKALEDRELAEHLAKVYQEICDNSVFNQDVFGLLKMLLKTHHELKGYVPVRKVRERIRAYKGEDGMLEKIPYLHAMMIERMEQIAEKLGIKEEGRVKEEERKNPMFG